MPEPIPFPKAAARPPAQDAPLPASASSPIRPTTAERRHAEALRRAGYRPTTLERIADALSSDRFLLIYIGFVGGCFFTVGLAYCWSLFL